MVHARQPRDRSKTLTEIHADAEVDIIPATAGPYLTTNIEDGIALADASLRATLAATLPADYRRSCSDRTA